MAMKHYDLDGEAVAQLREAKGLTQADFAELCDVNPSYVSLLESGTRQPSAAIATVIAKVLGVKFTAITAKREIAEAP